jgi:hypothetical protein
VDHESSIVRAADLVQAQHGKLSWFLGTPYVGGICMRRSVMRFCRCKVREVGVGRLEGALGLPDWTPVTTLPDDSLDEDMTKVGEAV